MVIIKFMNKKLLNNYIKQIEIHIDENEAINDLKSLIQIDSRTNTQNENQIIEYWESKYSDLGLENKLYKTSDNRLNLISPKHPYQNNSNTKLIL